MVIFDGKPINWDAVTSFYVELLKEKIANGELDQLRAENKKDRELTTL